MKSKIIQVDTCVMTHYDDPGHWIVTTVLCENGTLWRDNREGAWYEVRIDRLEADNS